MTLGRRALDRLASYHEFWPYYVSQHLDPTNRLMHAIGTTLVIAIVGGAALSSAAWMVFAPIVGYGCAWFGHVAFERNRPATLRHPWWSLRAEFHMYLLVLSGQMRHELEHARRLYPQEAADFDARHC